jgi:glycosyltransferase involved in cell wall biosynthesis
LPDVKLHFKYRLWGGLPLQHRVWSSQLKRSIRALALHGEDPIIVHCRGESLGVAAAMAKRRDPRIRILVDIRGAREDEIGGEGILVRRLAARVKSQIARATAAADAINTVSHRLGEHIRRSCEVSPDVYTSVVGCCVDTKLFYFSSAEREARRHELKLNDRFVICYCGAMQQWQKPDAVAEAFAAIRRDMSDAHLLVITRDRDVFLRHLANADVDLADVTIRSVPHDQVPSHLMAADVGLLLREDIVTNRVASPVKFAEYLRCGLPVILTPYIGDFSELVTQEGMGKTIGLPVDGDEVIVAAWAVRRRLESEGENYRKRCSEIAGSRLSWEGQIGKFVDIYAALSGERPRHGLLDKE